MFLHKKVKAKILVSGKNQEFCGTKNNWCKFEDKKAAHCCLFSKKLNYDKNSKKSMTFRCKKCIKTFKKG